MGQSNSMKKTLSSPLLTFFQKFIFAPIWIGGFGFGVLGLLKTGREEGWGFLIAWIVGSIFIYFYSIRLKKVQIDEQNIYISNYIKSISVPISAISRIDENIFLSGHPIFIKLKDKTPLGKVIVFNPKGGYYFRSHPVADELRSIIKKTPRD